MKAAVIRNFGNSDSLKIEDIKKPIIKDDEVLINVRASSINPVDWKHRKGNHKLIKGSKFPIVLGYDVAGIITEVGKNVIQYEIGDMVYARLNRTYGGGYAEFSATKESTLAKIPGKLSFEEAAAVPLAAVTALQGLRDKGEIKANENILINGAASGVGHFAIQIAKYYDTIVTAICSSRHTQMMEDLRADIHIDYKTTDIKNLKDKYDIIFDVVGTESYASLSHLLKPKGRYITTLPRPKVLKHKVLSVFSEGKKAKTFLMKSKGSDLNFLNNMVNEGKLKIYIDKVFPLEEISKAHDYSESGQAAGKIVIKI